MKLVEPSRQYFACQYLTHAATREMVAFEAEILAAYPQGTNLYINYLGCFEKVAEYRAFQAGIIDAIVAHGGSLSHHGIGRLLAPWMPRHLGEIQMGALRALKQYFDPAGILNPGDLLGLDGDTPTSQERKGR